jgi:hypothetical protein
MGRVAKGVKCSVLGCDEQAVRSLSVDRVASAGLKVEEMRRAYLCKEHYKKFKKDNKKERMLRKWRQQA